MDHVSEPCASSPAFIHMVLVALQCLTSVAVAYLTTRAVRKNRAEYRAKVRRTEEP